MSKAAESFQVLIVDDDPTMRMMMRESIESIGGQVEEAESGDKGLVKFQQNKYDAILLDVNMPGKDGLQVCKEIRHSPGGEYIPIMMATSADDFDTINKAYECEATDFVTKPMNWDLLGFRVRNLVRTSHIYADLVNSKQQLFAAKKIAKIVDWNLDLQNNKLNWSDELCELLGIAKSQEVTDHKKLLEFVHPDDKIEVLREINALLQDEKPCDIEYRVIRTDGAIIYVHEQGQVVYDKNGYPSAILGTLQDITKRKQAEEKIRYLAYHDSLTGLPNRAAFNDNLELAILKAKHNNENIAIAFLDLDNFKYVNDSLGHNVGDKLLRTISDRIVNCIRYTDTLSHNTQNNDPGATSEPPVCRVGGDEFIVILQGRIQQPDLARMAQRIIDAVKQPIVLDNNEFFTIGISIGIALYPVDGEDVNALLKHADTAMYQAKNTGKSNFCFYNKKINQITQQRFFLESAISSAISNQEFYLVYQPKLSLTDMRVMGLEALIRWHHPRKGLILPNEFIPIAEDSGDIYRIGEWVLLEACEQAQHWHEQGYDFTIAVNISPRQFMDKNLVSTVRNVLRKTKLDPQYLSLELTETTVMENTQHTLNALVELKALGIKIHLDDFGTGHSSLRYLSQFPVDCVKIDRSFIENIPKKCEDTTIVRAIISLAHSLDFSVVAEGVENQQQLDFLREYYCDQIQGFYFSKPLNTEDLQIFMQKGNGSGKHIFDAYGT
jgi:PAS domain S-box-containing protein